MRIAPSFQLTKTEQTQLEQWARGRRTPARLVLRAKIALLAAERHQNQHIATVVGSSRPTVGLWRQRFATHRIAGITQDAPRGGRPPKTRQALQERIVTTTLHTPPPAATHWSLRTLAQYLGTNPSLVQRVWKAHGLKPHLVRTFKLSQDPQFLEKLNDVVGLYLNPPEHALVLSVDEKSQIQALDRTQPGLPLKKGRGETMTHDYKRHGTTTLFAALNVVEGHIISTCLPRHRHTEWLTFLRLIDRQTPKDKALHLIVDNYATHKHPKVQQWLTRHSRFHMHFTPTSSSWLNLVERFFGELTSKRLRRGVFQSVPDLIQAIKEYITHKNAAPKPFVWTAAVTTIMAKVSRAQKALDKTRTA